MKNVLPYPIILKLLTAIQAYWVVNTIRYQLKNQGINHQWNEVVRIMNTQKAVTTTACNNSASGRSAKKLWRFIQ